VGKVALADFELRDGERTVAWDTMKLDLDAHIESNAGLRINRAELSSDFANASVRGTASNLRADVTADLERLQDHIGRLIEMGPGQWAGLVSSTIELRRADEGHVDVLATTDGRDILCRDGQRQLDVRNGRLTQRGRITLDGRKVT